MADDSPKNTRRYLRAVGPFSGFHLGLKKTPVLIFNLNVGGGFVTFSEEQPPGASMALTIDLGQEGRVTVKAQRVYRVPAGIGVSFENVDPYTSEQIAHAVERVRALDVLT